MKKILSLILAASMLLSLAPASLAEGGAEYIAAPYNVDEVDPRVTYLEPAFYENENGPTIGVTTVGVIKKDGFYFKDADNDKELDVFEDWRVDADTRAADLVSKMSLVEQAGFTLNSLFVNPVSKTLAEVMNEDGTVNPQKVFTVLAEGEKSPHLTMYNRDATSRGYLDDQVLMDGKVRAGVYRGALGYDASVVALLTNIATEIIEWDAAKSGTPALPYTLISNPIAAGFPDSLGMAAAVLGDGNFDAIRDYAEVDRQMWRSQGIIFMYGPQIDLATDPRWPRNSGTYGEHVETVAGIATALVDGYQGGTEGVNEKSVVLSVKHFPGDGAAENGFESHTYQGQWRLYPTEGSLEKYQLVAFQAAIDAGVGAIMPCYSRDTADGRSVTQMYRGQEVKVSELGAAYSDEIITKLLRETMGFKGVVNSDSGITRNQTYGVETLTLIERFSMLIEAGVDAIGGELFTEGVAGAVVTGMLDKSALDRANINRATMLIEQGLIENAYLDYLKADEVRATNMATAQEQSYQLHLKSTVLMKNHDAALPLKANAGTKLYIESFTGTGSEDATVEAFTALFEAQGFEIVSKPEEAEVAYLHVQPKATNSTNAGPTEAVLSLVEEFEVPERDMSTEGVNDRGTGSQKRTGEMVEVTTVESIDEVAEIAEILHAKGGKVVATIVCTSPWIVDALEPHVDALLAQYTTSAASLANAQSAQVDVMVGNYNPTGKLSMTHPACEAVIALTEMTREDGTTYDLCASPNDVPGYEKDQYMSAEVLAQSPSGSYAYMDADGNLYKAGFGLSY